MTLVSPTAIANMLGDPDAATPERLTARKVGRVLNDLELRDNPDVCQAFEETLNSGIPITRYLYDWSKVGDIVTKRLRDMWPGVKLRAVPLQPKKETFDQSKPIQIEKPHTKEWSEYQRAIFDEVKNGDGHLVVLARAGSGKSSTIIESLRHLNPNKKIALCAFNRQIFDELKKRAPNYVTVKTIHSFGLLAHKLNMRLHNINIQDGDELVNSSKAEEVAEKVLLSSPRYQKLIESRKNGKRNSTGRLFTARREVANLVKIGKNTLSETETELFDLAERFAISSKEAPADLLAKAARQTMLQTANDKRWVDFEDMIWFPYWFQYGDEGNRTTMPQYDILFVDEAQDLCAAQMDLINRMCKPGGRIIAFGDDRQCHPPGTMIRILDGKEVPIQTLMQGQPVVAWDRHSKCLVGRKKPIYKAEVSSRNYKGDLVEVFSSEKSVQCTPDHRWTIKTRRPKDLWCVYLMRRGDVFRVGWCQIFDKNRAMHLRQRTRLEKAEATWILSIHKSKRDVSLQENLVSNQYNLPLVQFQQSIASPNAGLLDQKYFDEFWDAIGDNQRKAKICLEAFHRDIRFPLIEVDGKPGRKRSTVMEVEACNLIPEFMQVPVAVGQTKDVSWEDFSIKRLPYDGVVYSLNVPKYHHYVANGIVTHNCIYEWRGADRNTIPNLINVFGAKTLPLSVSYRCPQAVVDMAKQIVPDIEAAPNAKPGLVAGAEYGELLGKVKPGNFILSRTNAPLMFVCLALLRRGIPAMITGRDFGSSLRSLVKKSKANSMADLSAYLSKFLEGERKKYEEERPERFKLQLDKVETLRCIMADCRGFNDLFKKFEILFSDKEADKDKKVVCSTVHKSKGLESETVWLIEQTFSVKSEPEQNIWYVGITRSMNELFLVVNDLKEIMRSA